MKTILPTQFHNLFWEFDMYEICTLNHREFVIERILEKGDIVALKWILDNYSLKDIRLVVTTSDNISSETKSFWQLYLRRIYAASKAVSQESDIKIARLFIESKSI